MLSHMLETCLFIMQKILDTLSMEMVYENAFFTVLSDCNNHGVVNPKNAITYYGGRMGKAQLADL